MSAPFVEDARVAVAGGECFVRRWRPAAAAAAPPLVLLHDSLGSVAQWRDFPAALALALRCEVIAYDRLGFGASSPLAALPGRDFIAAAARRFAALRAALGLDAFGLFGHSVGGAMALVIAATQGEACRFVVSESAQAFVEERTCDGIRAAQARFADPAEFARLARWHGARAQWVLQAWTQVWLDPGFAGWRLDAWLARVRCPVLLIHGDRDEFGSIAFPQCIARGVAGAARLALLEGCGHVPHRERAEDVLRLVAGFVGATPD